MRLVILDLLLILATTEFVLSFETTAKSLITSKDDFLNIFITIQTLIFVICYSLSQNEPTLLPYSLLIV